MAGVGRAALSFGPDVVPGEEAPVDPVLIRGSTGMEVDDDDGSFGIWTSDDDDDDNTDDYLGDGTTPASSPRAAAQKKAEESPIEKALMQITTSFFVCGNDALAFLAEMAKEDTGEAYDGPERAYTKRLIQFAFGDNTDRLEGKAVQDARWGLEAVAHGMGLTAAASTQLVLDGLYPDSLALGTNKVPPPARLLYEVGRDTKRELASNGHNGEVNVCLEPTAQLNGVAPGNRRTFTVAVGPEDYQRRRDEYIRAKKVPPNKFVRTATYADVTAK